MTENTRQELMKEFTSWLEAEVDGNEELRKAEGRLAKLERMERNLQRLVISEQISFDDFKEYWSLTEPERAGLNNPVHVIRQGQHLRKTSKGER